MLEADLITGLLGLIFAVVRLLSGLLIYLDATKHKIGKIIGDRSFTNMKAGAWAGGAFIIPIIFVPIYLFRRKKLLSKALESPVIVTVAKRRQVIIILIMLFILVLVNTCRLLLNN